MKPSVHVFAALFAGFLLPSCAMKNQRVQYNLDDIPGTSYASLNEKVLLVREFTDGRQDFEKTDIQLQCHTDKVDGKASCGNADRHYKFPVPIQMRDMIAAHLRKRGAFKAVVVDEGPEADFVLAGKIERFYGRQGYSTKAAVGAQFGLIGALLTMGAKTEGEVHIRLSELKLLDREGNLVRDLGVVEHGVADALPADASCWRIYPNVNDELKVAVEGLANLVEDAGVQFAVFKK